MLIQTMNLTPTPHKGIANRNHTCSYNVLKSDCVSFKGVDDRTERNSENSDDNSLWSKTTDTFKRLFHRKDYKNLTKDEVQFITSYVNKEDEIKQKYEKKIADIKDGFLDNWFPIAEKKREALRNDRDMELRGARQMQELFEEREKENLVFRQEFLKLAEQLNYSQEVISALHNGIESTKKHVAICQRRQSFDEQHGLKKIAGYVPEQVILQSNFIDKVDNEKAGKVLDRPITNSILFYGPTGCGKTTFAEALAEEADCRFERVRAIGRKQHEKEQNFFDELDGTDGQKGILDRAQENFLKDNKRTIVLVDEFDRFFGKGGKEYSDSFLSDLKDLFEKSSNENHVTFFLTTNDPKKIPYELLSPHRTGIIVSLDPPDKNNATFVLQHYFKDSDQSKIDYEKINGELFKYAPDQVYSNSHLKQIADIASTKAEESEEKINTDIVLNAIEEFNSQSDNEELIRITKPYLEKYEKEKKEIGAMNGQ